MLLRNQDAAHELLKYDSPETTTPRYVKPETNTTTNGYYFEHNGAIFGLGVMGNIVYVVLEGRLLLHQGITTTINQHKEMREFVLRKDSTLWSITYKPTRLVSTQFYTADDEDGDGFLLLHNVLTDAGRLARFIEANS